MAPSFTTDALFLRVVPFNRDDAHVERWRKIKDTDANRQLSKAVEYSGEVFNESMLPEDADDVEDMTDFIRFKTTPLSSAGLIDRSFMEQLVLRNRKQNKSSENPANRQAISREDEQIILGEEQETVFLAADQYDVPYHIFENKTPFKVRIPDGTQSVEADAFDECYLLQAVQIPPSVTTIEAGAFMRCTDLTLVELPAGVESVENSAFNGCSSMTTLILPPGLEHIGKNAFQGCRALTSVDLPDGLDEIGESAFANCSGLTSIVLPEGITAIGKRAFFRCHSLTSVHIPRSVMRIDIEAFGECTRLASVQLPKHLKKKKVARDAFPVGTKVSKY